ncbi:MAG: gliding motility-associated C-terminal domain-containing protein [Ferruginibacter sp.]|nr:gliding motility-associated C-terminal domain-containing protein [Ferruginibacter sp.]
MQRLFYTTLFACTFLLFKVDAQNKSNRGKEFWLGYGFNRHFLVPNDLGVLNNQELALYISTSQQPAVVTVSVNNTTWTQTLTIPANTANATIKVPKTGAVDARILTDGLSNRAIHIVSDVPVAAYAHQYDNMFSAATMLMPVESYGYKAYSINWSQTKGNSKLPAQDALSYNYRYWLCYFYVVASEDNTSLQITPSDTTQNGWLPNQTYTVNLNKGEIFNLFGKDNYVSDLSPIRNSSKDLTGSKVVAVAGADGNCHPFALFSGSGGVRICYADGGEAMMQQVFPEQSWGTRYLTYHTINNEFNDIVTTNRNYYRVCVSTPSAIVKRNGVPLTGLINNFYYELVDSTGGDFIESDKPITVAQFTPNRNQCWRPPTGMPPQPPFPYGDPEMFYLSPIEQGQKSVIFYTDNKSAIDYEYVNIYLPTTSLPSLRVDGNTVIAANIATHPNKPDYSVAIQKIALVGQHSIICDSTFTATVYGLGLFESYGYNVGCNINNLNSYAGVSNVNSTTGQVDNVITCPKTPAKILAKIAYQATAIKLKFSQVSGVTPAVDWTDNAPVPLGTESINGRTYYVYATTPNYEFASVGDYTIPIEYTSADINGCSNTEYSSIIVRVSPGPTANFTIAGNTCPNENVLLNNANVPGVFNITRYLWDFPDATTQTNIDATKTFTSIGNYNVRYRIFADNGCVGDTTKVVSIGSPQVSAITATGKACADSVFTFTSSILPNSANPPSWYWNFGDGTSTTITNTNIVTHSYAATPTNPVRHAVNFTQGCGTDTTQVTVPLIHPNPTASFSIKKDTLCADKPLLFESGLSAINNWVWNFGNGSSNNSPPFLHNYAQSGNYDVSLIVTDVNGCGSLPATDNIFINPKPLVDAGTNRTIAKGSSTLLNATINPAANYSYLWTPGGTLNTNTILQPLAKPTSNTMYYLYAENPSTFCSSSDSVLIKILPIVYIPNAFTPNGDSKNSTWRIPAMAEFPNGIVTVYNRYGEKVYESKNNATNPWNGTFKGKALPMGTYTYIVQLNNALKETFTGTVILIR